MATPKLNIIYYKLFEVEKFCSCRNELLFAGKHSQLYGSLVWSNPTAQGHYGCFTG